MLLWVGLASNTPVSHVFAGSFGLVPGIVASCYAYWHCLSRLVVDLKVLTCSVAAASGLGPAQIKSC